MYKIAICDDDKRYRKTIREIIEHESEYVMQEESFDDEFEEGTI